MKNKIHLSLISLALAFTTAHAHANYADIEKQIHRLFSIKQKAHPQKRLIFPNFYYQATG